VLAHTLDHAARALVDPQRVTAVIYSSALLLLLFYFQIVTRQADPGRLALLLISSLVLSLQPIIQYTTPMGVW
jgi:hypothetical protein